MSSAKSVTRARMGRKPAHERQNSHAAPDMTAPITDRYRLSRLRKLVGELRANGKSYRWIAEHTWRGEAAYGYYNRIDAGDHLKAHPQIRPREQDYHDLELVTKTLRGFRDANDKIFDLLMEIVRARAALDGAVVNLINEVRK